MDSPTEDILVDGSLLALSYSNRKNEGSSQSSALDLIRVAIQKFPQIIANPDEAQSVLSLLQGVEEHLEREDEEESKIHDEYPIMNSSLPFDSTPVAPTMAYSKRKKVLMENQLDLNENELDYYEDIVNDLAEKLEKMTQEKEDLQSVSSSLGERLKIVNEEKNKILAESEKRIDSLEKELRTFEEDRTKIAFHVTKLFESLDLFLQERTIIDLQQDLSSSESLVHALSAYGSVFSEISVSSETALAMKEEQMKTQGKQLIMLQDTIHEQKIRLDTLVRENSVLLQELQVLKSGAEKSSIELGYDPNSAKLSEELKVIELTANLKDSTKLNQKLSLELESAQHEINLKIRNLDELQNENARLREVLSDAKGQINNMRISDANFKTSNKLRQLDQDEEFELLKRDFQISLEKQQNLEESLKVREQELMDERVKNRSIQLLLQKFGEKEETNDILINELKRNLEEVTIELTLARSNASQQSSVEDMKSVLFAAFQHQFEKLHSLELAQFRPAHEKLSRMSSCLRSCQQSLIKIQKNKLLQPECNHQGFDDEIQRLTADVLYWKGRCELMQSRAQNPVTVASVENDDAHSLKSMLVASEKKLEQMSAEYARNFAQNTKVFAYLESECLRLKALCDHLRSVNGKINAELRKAMVHQIKNRGYEHRIKMLLNNETVLMEKCRGLENSLRVKNDSFLQTLRVQQEGEQVKSIALESELEQLKKKCGDLEHVIGNLQSANNELTKKANDAVFQLENEKKIYLNKLELAQNESLVLARKFAEKEIDLKSLKDKLVEQNVKLSQCDVKMSLLTEELQISEETSSRTISDLKTELIEKAKKLESISFDLQKVKSKLLESETLVMTQNEEYSQLLLHAREKDEKLSQLSKNLDGLTKQNMAYLEENGKLKNELNSKLFLLTDLTSQVDNLSSALNSTSHSKQDLEDLLRISQEKVDNLENNMKNSSVKSKEFQDIIQEKDKKIYELQEKVFVLEEKNEFTSTSLESLKNVNQDLASEVESLLRKNSELEIAVSDLRQSSALHEDKIFDLEMISKQLDEKNKINEKKVFAYQHEEKIVMEKLKAVSFVVSCLTRIEIPNEIAWFRNGSDSNVTEVEPKDTSFYAFYSEVTRLEDLIEIVVEQLRNLRMKVDTDSKQREMVSAQYEQLKIVIDKKESELETLAAKVKKLESEKNHSLVRLSTMEEHEVKSRRSIIEKFSQIEMYFNQKTEEIAVSLSLTGNFALDYVGADSKSLLTQEDSDFMVAFSRLSSNLHLFLSQFESFAITLANRIKSVQKENSQLVNDLNEEKALKKKVEEEFTVERAELQDQLRHLNETVTSANMTVDELRAEIQNLKQTVLEMSHNNSELEKEFKSITTLNVELAQSLSDAENLCLDLRSNSKSLQQQLEDAHRTISQLQSQSEIFQRRAADCELRLESLSFSYKRLKAEREAIESVRLNLENELERFSIQPVGDTSSNAEALNSYLFEIEKISSALESVMTLIDGETDSHATVLEFNLQSEGTLENYQESLLRSKAGIAALKLEKLRNWVRSETKAKQLLEKQLEILREEASSKETDELGYRDLIIQLQSDLARVMDERALAQNDLLKCRQELELKMHDCVELSNIGSQLKETNEDLLKQKSLLESETRRHECEVKRLNSELQLREELVGRLREELTLEQSKLQDALSELSQRLQQLESSRVNREAMVATIQKLESRLSEEQAARVAAEQQIEKKEREDISNQHFQEELQRLQSLLESYKKENTAISSDKLHFEQANAILRRELELTRNKALSLEQHVALVQQEKSVYQDEINETRRKIQLAKENFELEKAQRIKSEATAAALRQAQDEGRKRMSEYHVLTSQSISRYSLDEDDKRELKSTLKKIKAELEEKTSANSLLKAENAQLLRDLSVVKEQLLARTAELKSSQIYSSNLRSEGRNARRKLMEVEFALKEISHLISLDLEIVEDSFVKDGNLVENEAEAPLALDEALGIQHLSEVANSVKLAFIRYRGETKHLKQRIGEMESELGDSKVLQEKFQSLIEDREAIEQKYLNEIQTLQSQIRQFSSHDTHSENLTRQISSLENMVRKEREQKEVILKDFMEFKSQTVITVPMHQLQLDFEKLKSENSVIRADLASSKVLIEDLKREIEAINHHRTVLKSLVEEFDNKIRGFPDKSNGEEQVRSKSEEDSEWENIRLKHKVHGLSELVKLYRVGILALYTNGTSYSMTQHEQKFSLPLLDWMDRDRILQNFYEEDIRILDTRIEELQVKLRQYRKYCLEVRKQFEEILKSVHRAGKQPTMDIAIRQIEQLRNQLEESQDFIASIQEEGNEDRQYYRNKLNLLFTHISFLEKLKDYSLFVVHKIESICLLHSLKDPELEEALYKISSFAHEHSRSQAEEIDYNKSQRNDKHLPPHHFFQEYTGVKFPVSSEFSQANKDLIFNGLRDLYEKKVLPLEIASKFSNFGFPSLEPSDFSAKPMVLVLGQYSVGKTSFIRSLLKQDFPGLRIGPEPTTDRFTAIMHSDSFHSRHIPGHALVMQPAKPFRGLASFGNNFLSKFEGAEVSSAILRNITIIDSPGVLAGEKQRIGRDYDYAEVIRWFAERSDMIIVMFDAHKLDISDELKAVLDALRPYQEKIRIVLNKADSLDSQSLLRVYGALMWSLGKVVQTPEACRVYLGSFWDTPLKNDENRLLLEREKTDLINEMMSLPQNAAVRRINELVKRARRVKVHAYVVHYLRKQMPYVMGKSEKQKKLIDRLDSEFLACARRYNLPLGDFPSVNLYKKILTEIKDISEFKKLDKNLIYDMDRMMTADIPNLLQQATSFTQDQTNKLSFPKLFRQKNHGIIEERNEKSMF